MAEKKSARRTFLEVVPAAVIGAVGSSTVLAQGRGAQDAGPIDAAVIKAAEALDGLTFTSDEETRIAAGAVNNLTQINRLRQITIPHDTEPAYIFKPHLPGKEPKGPATPGAAVRFTKAPLTLKRPANLEDVAFWPVTRLAALIERRLVTSTELTEMYLARLKRYQSTLNFYVTLTEDLALRLAADADREIKAGRYRGPLHGIPWGAKDLFATKGIKTTWGAEPYIDQVIDYDATIVERLASAGAVLVAKLSLGALAQGDQWFGGRTNNPWQPDPKNAAQGSSGSSAGPGSATAAGCVGFAIGTETQGSILSPAGTNGVVGLRPTYGRVSRYGAMALATTMDKIGPMCRYVEDAVVVFNAIYGPDRRDTSVADAAFTWNPATPLSGYTIGYLRGDFEPRAGGPGAGAAGAPAGGRGGLSPEQLTAVLDVYRKLGATLEPVEAPDPAIAQASALILQVEASASFDDMTRSGAINQLQAPAMSRSTWPNNFRQARFVPAVEYIRAMRARTILMHQMDAFMSKYHAILSPGDPMSTISNRTGHPAISLKAGFAGGLPRPLVITGKPYEEATICRLALAYEQATEWKDRHPTLG